MPISDEIIELEPVKKSKSKLIIMFVIMGVLFALAVTFLILYILKPNVEDYNGHVNGVEGEASELFVDSSNDADRRLASVGRDYTVYADVSAEGVADPGVSWTWEPSRAIVELSHGSVGGVTVDGEDGQSQATRFYFTFRASSDYADGSTPVTITARSMSDVNQRTDITFYIVNQGTESIELQRISLDGGAYQNISYDSNGELSLPYYSNDKNNKLYQISFRQLGKYNPTTGKYSDLTMSNDGKDGQPTYKVDISTDKADTVISSLRLVDSSDNTESFRFKLCGAGTATITLTANNYNNFGAPVSVTLKIKAETTATLGYIDDIRIYANPVDDTNGKFYKDNVNKQYTQVNYGAIPRSDSTLTLPYSVPSYSNFLQHIVLLPLSIQYNEDGTRKADWSTHVSVSSSLKDLLDVSNDALKNIILKTNSYGAKNTCTLTVTSTDRLGIVVSSAINVNVVAQNTEATISVKKEGSATNEDVTKNIATSQGSSLDVSIAYAFTAPSDINRDTFVTGNYLSRGYFVSVVSKATGQEVKDFTLKLGDKTIEWGKQQTVDTSMVIAKVGAESSTKYTGTLPFKLSIPLDSTKVPDGDYTFTFRKVGTPGLTDTNGRVVSDLDTSWSRSITLSVTAKAREASFINEQSGADMARLGGNSGNFVIDKENNHEARLYLQNRSGSLPQDFSFKDFVVITDGVGTVNVSCSSPTGNLTVIGGTNNQSFSFPGKKQWNENSIQGVVTLTAKNNVGEVITGEDFKINIYLIDAVDSISVDAKGDSSFFYNKDSIASSGTSFAVDMILNTFTFRQAVDIYNGGDVDKYNNGAHNNFELYSRIGSDLAYDEPLTKVIVGDSIEFKYPDKNGTTVFEYVNGSIYPRVDLYEFSYNNNINVTVLTVKYFTVPDARFETEKNIKSCSRSYTFVRRADDVALFESNSYATGDRIYPDDNTFAHEINMGDTGYLYSSAVVNIVKTGASTATPVVINYAARHEENKEFINRLNLEDVYLEKPSGDGFTVISGETKNNGYYNMIFNVPQIVGDIAVFPAVVHGARDGYRLNVIVFNRARPIDTIELFSEYSSTGTKTPLSRLDFGEFGNLHSDTDKDTYRKEFYIKATYFRFDNSEEDKLYTLLEPVIVTLPNAKFTLVVDEVDYIGKSSYELVAPKMVTGEYYYIWKCELTLNADADDIASGELRVTDKFAESGDNSNHITVGVPLTIGSGAESIDFTVNGIKHNVKGGDNHDVDVSFVLTSADDDEQRIEIAFSVNPYSASFGDKNIVYDLRNLSFQEDSVDGLLGSESISLGKLALRLDREKIKTMSGQYVFTLIDTANGANTIFKITLNVTVKADIYLIEHVGDSYTITTSGADRGEKTLSDSIKYNGGTATRQPDSAFKKNVDIKVVKGGTGSEDYVNDGTVTLTSFNKDTGVFTIAVANDVLRGNYALRIYYKSDYNEITEYVLIKINTDSNEVKWLGEADGNVPITSGTAEIKVANPTDRFHFLARVYNRGDGKLVSGDTSKVTYAVYDDVHERNIDGVRSTVADVTTGGLVYLKNPGPTSARGTIYLRASYIDESSGKTFFTDVNIVYNIVITSFSIVGVDEDTYKADTFNLYYQDNNAYTTLNLSGMIQVATAFGVSSLQPPVITLQSGDTEILKVAGFTLIPLKAGTATLTITAYGGIEYRTHTYTVNIISLDELALERRSADINVVENESIDITRIVSDDKYKGLVGIFSVSAPSKINVGAVVDNKTVSVTVDRGALVASDYRRYALTAITTYQLKANSSLEPVGELYVSANFDLNVIGTYIFSFDLYIDDNKINVGDTNSIVANASYKVVVDTPNGVDWYDMSDWEYHATDANGIVKVGNFNGNEAVLTFDSSKAGVISLSVTATAYGRTYNSKTQTYTFTYGNNATTRLEMSSNGGASFGALPASTIAIDYDENTPKRIIRYIVDVSKVGDVVSDVVIDCVGKATAGNVQYNSTYKYYYRDFTIDGGTSFIVSGTFKLGGRTYFADKYSVELTTTAPDFVLSETSGKTELRAVNKDAFETATFDVGYNSGFKGNVSVEYSIVQGGVRATINLSTGVLTPNLKTNTTDGSVIVRAAITVNSGVFAGTTYTIDKIIYIKGVSLPTLMLKNASVTTGELVEGSGATVALGDKFVLSGDSRVTYEYGYSYSVVDVEASGMETSDYEINGSTLTVKDTAHTRAGGIIKVQIMAVVNSAINEGASAMATLEIVVMPRATVSENRVSVPGAIGSYDISSAVRPYTSDTDMSGFVNKSDKYTVTYSLAPDVDGIKASGDRLVISKPITSSLSVTLNAKLVFTSGAYDGLAIEVNNVIVDIRGLTFNDVNISWQTDGYMQAVIDSNVIGVENIKSIAFTLKDNGAFVTIDDKYPTKVVITIDKYFNIAESGNKIIKYSAIVEIDGSDVPYYGEGVINVAAVKPTFNMTINDIEVSDGHEYYVNVGDSFGVTFAETHGFVIDSLTVGEVGFGLTYVVGGANCMFTATAIGAERDITFTVTVNGVSATFTIAVTVNAKPASPAFTATNTNITLLSYGSGTGEVISVLTPSSDYPRTTPSSLTISSGSNYYDSTLYNNISYVYVYGYTTDGTRMQLGSAQPQAPSAWGYVSNSLTVSLSRTVCVKYEIRFVFKLNVGAACTLSTTFNWANDSSNSGKSTSYNYSYNIARSGSITVTYDSNGGSYVVPQTYNSVQTVTRPGNPERLGYKFEGWYTVPNPTASDTAFKFAPDASAPTICSSITLYARWSLKSITIYFDNNGGSGVSSITRTFGTLYDLPTPTRTGYTFTHWLIDSGNNKIQFTDTIVRTDEDFTLYAEWEANTYYVFLSYDDGTGKAELKAVKFGSYYNLPMPTRTGYTFSGWYQVGSSTRFDTRYTTVGTEAIVNGGLVLVAKWSKIPEPEIP